MGRQADTADTRGRTFLGRLVRDVRGNTLAIMAAALIPLAGMVGGGIDMSRMYITKTRLQHACDAGALAGRKNMGGGAWGTDDQAVADQFFAANYQAGSYGSTALTHSYTENAGRISGTASAVLPMTLLRVLGFTTQTLAVACNAEMRLPNTDIMFVLDNTGSMACNPDGTNCTSSSTSKIVGLKVAVKCFYEIVAKLDTDATCTTGTPSGGTSSQVQVRFGFMPYSTNVNVGHLLPSSYFVDRWTYPSRQAISKTVTTYTFDTQGTPTLTATSDSAIPQNGTLAGSGNTTQSICASYTPASSTAYASGSEGAPYSVVGPTVSAGGNQQTTTYKTDQLYKIDTYWYYTYDGLANPQCKVYKATAVTFTRTRSYSRTDTGTPHSTQVFDKWHYANIEWPVSPLKNGSGWVSDYTLNLPVGANGTVTPVVWDGCIEERKTVSQTTYSSVPSTAYDLNIDMLPTSDTDTQWKPALPGLVFARRAPQVSSGPTFSEFNGLRWDFSKVDASVYDIANDYNNGARYYCPAEARKLQTWPDPTTFDTYVDSLTPTGNTYHDIGMIWGARFMSPTGIFASENATTPSGGKIDRHMIFMTDGDAQASACDYSAYGVQFYGGRTTSDVGPANQCAAAQYAGLTNQVNARLDALCTVVKNMNITLWVISFGRGSNTATETRLSNCASPGRYFAARDSATLQSTFADIANQISQLRLTQ